MTGKIIRSRLLITRWGEDVGHADEALYIRDGRVHESGPLQWLISRYPSADQIGDGSHLVTPGFVNSHSHGRGTTTLRQGIPDDPGEVRSIGLRIGLSGDPYWDILLSCSRQLEAGITSTMHLDTNYGFGPADAYSDRLENLIRAYADSGIRFSVAMAVRDPSIDDPYLEEGFLSSLEPEIRKEIETWRRPLPTWDEYLEIYRTFRKKYPNSHIQLEPALITGCSDDFLTELREVATSYGSRIQLHLAETAYQKSYSLKRFGRTTVHRLAELDFLRPDVSCAHCVWLNSQDIGIMRDAGATVVYNPSSNLRLRSGLAPIKPMIAEGIPVALGTDNLSFNDGEDILEEARLGQILQSPPGVAEAPITAGKALQWATEAGSKVLGIADLGRLERGCPADLIMWNMQSIEKALFEDNQAIDQSVIQWIRQKDIDKVLVGGTEVVTNGRYVWRDRTEIETKARETIRQWQLTPGTKHMRSIVAGNYSEPLPQGTPYFSINSMI